MIKCEPSMVAADQDAHSLALKKADLRVLLFLEQLHPVSSVKSKALGSERHMAHMAPAPGELVPFLLFLVCSCEKWCKR